MRHPQADLAERAAGHDPHRPETLTLARPAPVREPDNEPAAPAGRVRLASAPKLRSVYWCNFWSDALRPEFYKNRPVVVVSRDSSLEGPVTVVPLTTKLQRDNKWAYKLTENPNPRRPGIDSWAVCNHIYSVSCARLLQMDGGSPRMKQLDFDGVVRLMLRALANAPKESSPDAEEAPHT